MSQKKLIQDKPIFGELSQYNFDSQTNDFSYENSTSLPKNNDKFQNKDLFTTTYSSEINEVIIKNNLKFFGESFIRVDNIKVDNAGVNYKVKNIRVRGFLFDLNSFRIKTGNNTSTPENSSYSILTNTLNGSDFTFYDKGFSSISEGRGLGNLTDMEGIDIVSNIGKDDVLTYNEADFPGGGSFSTGSAFTRSNFFRKNKSNII